MFILNQDKDMLVNTENIKIITINDIDENIPGEEITAIDIQGNKYVLGSYWLKDGKTKEYLPEETHKRVKTIMQEIVNEMSGYKLRCIDKGVYSKEKTEGKAYEMPII